MGFKERDFLLQGRDVFVLLDQHREQHRLERRVVRKIGAGRRMVAGGGEQGIEGLLILPAQRPAVSSPGVDFLLNQLREGGERASHNYNRFQTERGMVQHFESAASCS